MKTSLLLFAILIILSSPKTDCECNGVIKYYYKEKQVSETTFDSCFYMVGLDCAIIRGTQVTYDSVVIRSQLK